MLANRIGFTVTIVSIVISGGTHSLAIAQVVPDRTLPTPSTATLNGNTFVIDGGTTAGSNLFHSFDRFSIPTGNGVSFNNAANINNIFSRVTGSEISTIDGLLRTNGTANLFLLNPNGIIFGANARLNIGGSFLGSTAEAIAFADGFEFSTTNPVGAIRESPLLTVSVPVGLQFGANPGNIDVMGEGVDRPDLSIATIANFASIGSEIRQQAFDSPTSGLQIAGGETIALLGGNINISGGGIIAPRGNILLGSVTEPGEVAIVSTPEGILFDYSAIEQFGDINISQQSLVLAGGNGSGNVQIVGRQLQVSEGSEVEVSTLGSQPGGQLTVRTTDSVEVSGTTEVGQVPSSLGSRSFASGNAGNTIVQTQRLSVRDGGQVGAETFGDGNAGTVRIEASQLVDVNGTTPDGLFNSAVGAATVGAGNAGNVTIDTARLAIDNGGVVGVETLGSGEAGNVTVRATESVELTGLSDLSADTFDTGNAGNISIETSRLAVRDGANIAASTTGAGNAGNVNIAASVVEVAGVSADEQTESTIEAATEGTGNGGNLNLRVDRLIVSGGAEVSAETGGDGAGGTLTVAATDFVEVVGISPSGESFSVLSVEADGAGDGGSLRLQTPRLTVRDGARVGAAIQGTGNGGTVTIEANVVEVMGVAAVLDADGDPSVSALGGITEGLGNAGNVTIDTDRLVVSDGGAILLSTEGDGRAGNLTVRATESVEIVGVRQGTPSLILASSSGRGDAGNIVIETPQLSLRDGGGIVVDTSIAGNGGNINIAANRVEIQGAGGIGAQTLGAGTAGSIEIETRSLEIGEGSAVAAATLGSGDGGSVDIRASESVRLSGGSIAAGAFSRGNAGSVTVETGELSVVDGGRLGVGTRGTGNAGNLTIAAVDSVEVSNSTLSAQTIAAGNAGNVSISSDRLEVREGGTIAASGSGIGNPGSINITASDLRLEDASLDTTSRTGRGGNIRLRSPDIRLRRSNISAASFGGEMGEGNIDIRTETIVLLENSRLVTSAVNPAGGSNINIAPFFEDGDLVVLQSPDSQINAVGQLTIDGDIQVDPTAIPEAEAGDATALILAGCREYQGSEFYVTGRGGIPENPRQFLELQTALEDLGELDLIPESDEQLEEVETSNLAPRTSHLAPLNEATSWAIDNNGKVELISDPMATPSPFAIDCSQTI